MQRRTGRFANKNGVSLGSSSSCNTCILVHQGTKELHMVRYRRLTLMSVKKSVVCLPSRTAFARPLMYWALRPVRWYASWRGKNRDILVFCVAHRRKTIGCISV